MFRWYKDMNKAMEIVKCDDTACSILSYLRKYLMVRDIIATLSVIVAMVVYSLVIFHSLESSSLWLDLFLGVIIVFTPLALVLVVIYFVTPELGNLYKKANLNYVDSCLKEYGTFTKTEEVLKRGDFYYRVDGNGVINLLDSENCSGASEICIECHYLIGYDGKLLVKVISETYV